MYPHDDLVERLVRFYVISGTGANEQSLARRFENWMRDRNRPTNREDIFKIAFALELNESQLDYLLGLTTGYCIQYRDGYELVLAWFLRKGISAQLMRQSHRFSNQAIERIRRHPTREAFIYRCAQGIHVRPHPASPAGILLGWCIAVFKLGLQGGRLPLASTRQAEVHQPRDAISHHDILGRYVVVHKPLLMELAQGIEHGHQKVEQLAKRDFAAMLPYILAQSHASYVLHNNIRSSVCREVIQCDRRRRTRSWSRQHARLLQEACAPTFDGTSRHPTQLHNLERFLCPSRG